MIAALKGRLEGRGLDFALIEVGGVTFRVFAPSSTLNEIGQEGEIVQLHTYLYVRQDQLTLYGFSSNGQLDFFHLLLTVQGIGPSAALNILSAQPLEQLEEAIFREDVTQLSRIPRIGKKTAQRLILDLKGRIKAPTNLPSTFASANNEVIDALVALGYSALEVQQTLNSFAKEEAVASIEEKIMLALQRLGSGL